ncbi:hypothetical protein E9993_20760 [Labilibacter sediminis]|nr:hypothetical protein E9993_20760 [Labilibacter sediminis]
MRKKQYKGIYFNECKKSSLIELNFSNNKAKDYAECVIVLSVFTELLGHKQPRCVKINMMHAELNVYNKLIKYFNTYIANQIKSFGICEILLEGDGNKGDA